MCWMKVTLANGYRIMLLNWQPIFNAIWRIKSKVCCSYGKAFKFVLISAMSRFFQEATPLTLLGVDPALLRWPRAEREKEKEDIQCKIIVIRASGNKVHIIHNMFYTNIKKCSCQKYISFSFVLWCKRMNWIIENGAVVLKCFCPIMYHYYIILSGLTYVDKKFRTAQVKMSHATVVQAQTCCWENCVLTY